MTTDLNDRVILPVGGRIIPHLIEAVDFFRKGCSRDRDLFDFVDSESYDGVVTERD